MNTVTLQIENNDDYKLLLQILSRLKVKIVDSPETTSLKERQKLLSIIKKGGSGKSIADPVKWQKEMRKDRQLPWGS